MTAPEPQTPDASDGGPKGLAADIAQTIGTLLTQTAEMSQAAKPDDTQEIQAITDAMIRLFVGAPLRSDGQLTVKALAEEAGLRRNKLTHKHTGMKDLFYALVKTLDRPAVPAQRHAQDDDLKRRHSELWATHQQLRREASQMARVIHVLEVENRQLREQAANAPGKVHYQNVESRG
ncbi:hypothetical protein [Streptomyces sp. ISL-100]|uniref:hypothetical protein n=1 Tax=Streptomyces sp. ISL-100 TaxID=2819173 RepID=UPI001BE6C1C3|nr:hypothetical protein [Streptomyces sp. ISL-100]MBT2401477.1 hypothetical protein [Streptomyces sp. ISL-100]